MHRGNCLFTWKLTVDPLCSDHWSPQNQQRQLPFHTQKQLPFHTERQLPFHMQRQLPFHAQRWLPFHVQRQLPFLVKVDYWSSLWWLLIGSTEVITFSHAEVIAFSCREVIAFSHREVIPFSHAEVIAFSCAEAIAFSHAEVIAFSCGGESWLLILSAVIVDPPTWSADRDNRFWTKVGKHLGMPWFTEDIPFGKVQLIATRTNIAICGHLLTRSCVHPWPTVCCFQQSYRPISSCCVLE